MPGKSWRDPNFGFPLKDSFPVVCVSWNDRRAFAEWLTNEERTAGPAAGGLGIPTAHGSRVGIRLPGRQQREPLLLVGQ